MGSGGSKASSSRGSKERSKGKTRVFQSSCLGTRSRSRDSDNGDHQVYEPCDKSSNECNPCINQNPMDPDQLKSVSSRKAEIDSLDEPPCISSSDVELQEWDGSSRLDGVPEASSSSSIRASLNPSSRFFSRFSFNPGNVSFRLSRAASLGSSRDYRLPRTNLVVSDTDEDTQQDHELHYSSRVNRNHHQQHSPDTSNNRWSNLASGSFNNQRPNLTISSTADDGRDNATVHTPVVTEAENGETGPSDQRTGAREHAERNVRFSRTLSVGRLRDRVLRRSSLSESTNCPTESREIGQGSERQISTVGAAVSAGHGNIALSSPSTSAYSPAGLSRALFGIPDHDVDASRPREGTRYRDLLEHRSDFLDRRRRIRSQVRALQRLESRFENLSGHERSCILSGQHRNGRCTCRNGNRDVNTNDDTNTRASISRIVMLAEALFEVLDEIHQQSVVLSSRPSVSSIGSVPAPNEVVDSLPIKLYSKLHKHQNEDAAQCYICLVEYEEGESVRILPCHHEFHRACVDKWLKEIHRVCPLCRGDICRSELLSTENEAANHSAV